MRRAWLAMLVVACSSDDAIDVDAGDATMVDVYVDADAADVSDVLMLGEPYPEEPPPDPTLIEIELYQKNAATALCNRLGACCAALDAGAFDGSTCADGIGALGLRGFNADLLVPGVLTAGHLSFDQVAASSCLAGMATLSCPDIASYEIVIAWHNCGTLAVTGTSGVSGPCRADVECIPTAYCDTTADAGKCVALGGQDAACQRTDQCAYKGGPGPLYCNGATCQPRLAIDASCATNDTCESGICASAACATSYAINACAPDGGP